jgi:5-oxoprolinase (ATP-hydrolysing)
MTASILSNGRKVAAFGMAGGEAGAVGENYIERADGRCEKLAHSGQAEVSVDDVMVVCTPGGGGYGRRDK